MCLRRTFLAGLTALLLATAAKAGVWVHYSFDTDFTDSSGNGNDGILFDTDTLGNAFVVNTAAQFGAAGFYKADDADRVDLTTPFTPATGTPWTISFWATLSGGAASVGFSSTNAGNYILMRADVFNGVFMKIANQGELFFPIGLGQFSFHHYALVANGSGQNLDGIGGDDSIVLYVDGVAIAPSNGMDTTTYGTDIQVDEFASSVVWPYGTPGKFDEFWILDDALSSNRVAKLYTANTPNLLQYVDASATGANDGTSWANAFTNLADAIAVYSLFGDEIWVAAGRYYPDEGLAYTNDDRNATFALFPGLKLRGGFAGTETNVAQRNIAANATILSGDLDKNDTTNSAGVVVSSPSANTIGGNSYHVVRMVGTDSNSVLDGFTVTSGRADGVSDFSGSGLYSQYAVANILNCTFSGNYADYNGGGIYGSDGSMLVSNCTLFANYGGRGGGGSWANSDAVFVHGSVISNRCPSECGGLFIQSGSLRVEHAIISGNQANTGGGVFQQGGADMVLVNCILSGNAADDTAGAAMLKGGSATLVNCTISGNHALTNAAIRNQNSNTSHVHNCVIWNNVQELATNAEDSASNDGTSSTLFYNSIVHRSGGSTNWDPLAGIDSDENEDKDPLFITSADPATAPTVSGNFRTTHGSPAINSGNNNADLDGPGPGTNKASTIIGDLDGATRLVGTIDMGAYEFLDTDADRLSDWQEDNIYGSDVNDTDSDNDNVDDGDEAYAGTVLTNAASYLALTGAQVAGTNRVITWSSESNRSYRLWYSTNLLGGSWNNLGVYTSTPPVNTVTNAPAVNSLYYLIGVE